MKYDNCKDCVARCVHAGKDREFICGNGVSCKVTKKPIATNADKIRAMSDEGLATTLVDWDFCSDVCSQKYVDSPFKDKCPENCKEQALEWLQQPAEEGKL